MDAIEYLKTRTRMTNNCTINCDECLLHYKNNDKELYCNKLEEYYPNEAIKIVEKWSKEHPLISNVDKYKEVIKETFGDDFEIEICGNKPYENIPDCRCCMMNCDECIEFWNSEYIGKEKKNNG